jgi:hypothetical protein
LEETKSKPGKGKKKMWLQCGGRGGCVWPKKREMGKCMGAAGDDGGQLILHGGWKKKKMESHSSLSGAGEKKKIPKGWGPWVSAHCCGETENRKSPWGRSPKMENPPLLCSWG